MHLTLESFSCQQLMRVLLHTPSGNAYSRLMTAPSTSLGFLKDKTCKNRISQPVLSAEEAKPTKYPWYIALHFREVFNLSHFFL
jgi:hypothetical protein